MNQAVNNERKVLFFSNNKELADSISTEIQSIKLNAATTLSVNHEPVQINSDSDSDIIIYDLSLVNSDLHKALKDISRIKPLSSNKLVFLIGEKEELKFAKENKDINLLVTRYLRTQVTSKQLVMAIENDANRAPHIAAISQTELNPKTPNLKVLALLAIIVLTIALLIILVLKKPSSDNSEHRTATILSELEQPLLAEGHTSSATDDEFTQKGLNARVQGNIYEPLNDNALFYFKQALIKDSFNNIAYTNQQEILEAMRQDFPSLVQNQEFTQAQGVLDSLIEYQAFHQDNPVMQQRLTKAIKANKKPTLVSQETPIIVANKSRKPNATSDKQVVNASNSANKPVALSPTLTKATPVLSDKTTPIVDPKPTIKKPVINVAETKILPPKLIKRVEANYPRRAYNLDIEGWVELEFQVNDSGKPFNIKISDEEPAKFFSKAAIEALEKWQFSPARNAATDDAITSEITSTKFNFALGK